MEKVDIVNRNHEGISDGKTDSRKKEDRKIKLAMSSEEKYDSKFSKVLEQEKEKVEQELSALQNMDTSHLDDKENYVIIGIIERLKSKKVEYEKRIEKEDRRALRLEAEAKQNMASNEDTSSHKLDVGEIDRDKISDMIENEFKQQNEILKVDSIDESEKYQESMLHRIENEHTDYSQPFNSPELSSTLNDDNSVGKAYEFEKSKFIQGNMPNGSSEFMAPSTIPVVSNFLGSVSSDESFKMVDDISKIEDKVVIDENLANEINASLNSQSITSDSLTVLREKLEAARARKSLLTDEVAEKETTLTTVEKEAAAAEKEKNEKMRLVQDELEAYNEENRRLEMQKQQLDEQTQRQISMRQQSLATISALNEMIGTREVNALVQHESGKGGK